MPIHICIVFLWKEVWQEPHGAQLFYFLDCIFSTISFFLQFGSVPNAVSSHRDTPSSITIIIEYPRKFQSDANSCYRSIEKCLRSNELYFHSKIRMVVESSTDIEYIQEKSSYWMLLCIFCFLVLSGKCSKISFIHALY